MSTDYAADALTTTPSRRSTSAFATNNNLPAGLVAHVPAVEFAAAMEEPESKQVLLNINKWKN